MDSNTNPSVSLLISGSEILDGRVLDTNSHKIIETFARAGFSIRHTLSCTDDIAQLKTCLDFLCSRSEILLISGGMGPTCDDLTRETVSEWVGVPLIEREEARQHLTQFYAARGRVFDQSNHKQILFPEGATIIPNPRGSAPGFMIRRAGNTGPCWVFALPGVPGELDAMLDNSVIPLIAKHIIHRDSPLELAPQYALRVFGLTEALVGARVSAAKLPREIAVSFRAAFPEVHVLLKPPAHVFAPAEVDALLSRVTTTIGAEFIISESLDQSLDEVLHTLLKANNRTFAAAESCTGGMLGEMMTRTPGSSNTFLGSAVTYSNAAKHSLLSVSTESLAQHGAVSAPVAREMAQGAREKFSADVAVSITGVAGPDGGSTEKPVGTFFVGYCDGAQTLAFRFFFPNTRTRIRRFATFSSLDVVRRQLLRLPLPPAA